MFEPQLLVQGISRLLRLNAPEGAVDDLKTSKIVLIGSSGDTSANVHITCDIAAFRCHKVSKFTPLQYLLSFNSPFLVHNYLPYFLEVKYQLPNQQQKLLGILDSQEILQSYAVDGEDFKEVKTEWKVHMAEDTCYVCNTWAAVLGANNTSDHDMQFELRRGENERVEEKKGEGKETVIVDKFALKGLVRPHNRLINKYSNFTLREKVYENYQSSKIALFAQYAVVNKTDFPIDYGVKDKFSVNMKPHTNCLCDLGTHKSLNFRTEGYGKSRVTVEWSKSMQVTTVGVTGSFTMKRRDYKEEETFPKVGLVRT